MMKHQRPLNLLPVAVGLLPLLLAERSIVQWHFGLSYYEEIGFDRNNPCSEEKLRFVGLDYYNKIEVRIDSEPNAVQPFVGLVGLD